VKKTNLAKKKPVLVMQFIADKLKRALSGFELRRDRVSITRENFLSGVEKFERLGAGNFGEVFLPISFFFLRVFLQKVYRGAWNETTTVALKTVKNLASESELQREAQILQ
jgi:hypothetical protein